MPLKNGTHAIWFFDSSKVGKKGISFTKSYKLPTFETNATKGH